MNWEQDISDKAKETMKFLGGFSPTVHEKNKEVKGYMLDEDCGCKVYLSSDELREMAGSFIEVAHFQKRMDNKEEFESYPLCQCNGKLLVNVEHHKYTIHGKDCESCQISLVHENQDTDWCDLRIYSLSPEKLKENLQKYELKLLDMWDVFYAN